MNYQRYVTVTMADMVDIKDEECDAVKSAEHKKRFLSLSIDELVYLGFLGIGFTFLGWVVENTSIAITDGVIDSRYHILPFISPYGLIPFAFRLLLGEPGNISFFGKKLFKAESRRTRILSDVLTVILCCTAVFLGELAVGNLWDLLFGVQLWDYSNMPLNFLNVTAYTNPISTLGFGIGAFLIFRLIYIPVLSFLKKNVSLRAAKWVVLILGSLIVLDTLRMGLSIIISGEAPMLWQIKLR